MPTPSGGSTTHRASRRLTCERLETRIVLAARPVITEFVADNDNSLFDGNGESSDWIEIYNAGDETIDLAGWRLTDDPLDLGKWRFPRALLAPAEHLIVFASGKSGPTYVDAHGYLHTNFRLDGAGEYLALVTADGKSIVSQFGGGGNYPPQHEDVSYGLGTVVTPWPLVRSGGEGVVGSTARYFVPTSGESLAANWRDLEVDVDWPTATLGLGYVASTPFALVAYWPLNEGAGQIVHDLSGHGYDGILGAAGNEDGFDPIWRQTVVDDGGRSRGPVLDFAGDGAPQFVDLSAHVREFADLEAGTIAAWVKLPGDGPSAEAATDVILAASNPQDTLSELRFFYDPTADSLHGLRYDVRDRGRDEFFQVTSNPTDPGNDRWRHVAVTVDEDGLVTLFVDGAIAGEGEEAGFFHAVGGLASLSLGRSIDATGGKWHFRGQMSDVAVWSEPLPPAQIAQLAAGASPLYLHQYTGAISSDVRAEMLQANSSVFVRAAFTVDDPATLDALFLNVRYDGGFVAYLNGQEIARRNAPDVLDWNSAATAERPGQVALSPEPINVTAFLRSLRPAPATNVLAMHGLNVASADDDFLLAPELVGHDVMLGGPRYFPTPTPGAVNGAGVAGLVAAPTYSVARGFFTTPISVTLATTTPGATIRYTTDGTPPTATHGAVYAGPVTVSTTTPLRAAAFRDDYAASGVVTQTYLFLDDVLRQTGAGFPTFPGADYALDPRIVDDPRYAVRLRDDLRAIPTLSLALPVEDLFGPHGIHTNPTRRGEDWERSVSVEWLAPDGSPGFHVNAGLRMHGGASRANSPKKSFRLHFRETWGPEKLEYPVFGADAAQRFDVLVLRGGYNDIWTSQVSSDASDIANVNAQYVRDEWARATQLAMGHLSPHGTWVHLYLNGLYWGLYNVVERPDENFAASYLGGDESDYDVLSHSLTLNGPTVVAGDRAAWDALMGTLAGDVASDTVYQQARQLLDVDAFIDYMILNLYGGNRDWPHNNWYATRRRPDGKFQFFAWDGEMFLGFVDERRRLTTNSPRSPGYIYDRLRLNAEFRLRFADRAAQWFAPGGVLSPERAAARYRAEMERIAGPLSAEAARWGDYRRTPLQSPLNPLDHWHAITTAKLTGYFPHRTEIVRAQFGEVGLYPPLEPPTYQHPSGVVDLGFQATLDLPPGPSSVTAYYTTDGSDPRRPSYETELSLVHADSPLRVFVPTGGNGGDSLGETWRGGQEPFDDQAWLGGAGSVGYDADPASTLGFDLGEVMPGAATSVFVRVSFVLTAEQAALLAKLVLRARFSDGFIAYLNGVRIAAVDAPNDAGWDSVATGDGHDADAWQAFPLPANVLGSVLRAGENVLAIHALSHGLDDPALVIAVELMGTLFHPATIAASAREYAVGIPLTETTTVTARAFDGATWSPLVRARYVMRPPIRVTEIMYHPSPPTLTEIAAGYSRGDDFEFVELTNVGPMSFDLAGMRFDAGIAVSFSSAAVAPGERVVVARNRSALLFRHGGGIRVIGEYGTAPGNLNELNDGGELVRLVSAEGATVLEFAYDDQPPWPVAADGVGHSLVIRDIRGEAATWNEPAGWRASTLRGGSPGVVDRVFGDLDNDGRVGVRDLALLRRGMELPSGAGYDDGDLNSDGAVTLADFALLVAALGKQAQ